MVGVILLGDMPQNETRKSNVYLTYFEGETVKNRHTPHSSYFGLEAVAFPEMYEDSLNDRIQEVGRHSFEVANGKVYEYKRICLLDTFFSDSFPPNLLRELFFVAKRDEVEINIQLLDPFSPLAKLRAESLKRNNSILRLNKGLQNILYTLQNILPPQIEEEFQAKGGSEHFIYEQIERIEKCVIDTGHKNFDLRFTEDLTEVPVYIIGQFVVKGLISSRKSAYENPWCFFVDNPHTDDDLYKTYLQSFNESWQSAISYTKFKNHSLSSRKPRDKRKVFISYGHDEYAKLKIAKLVEIKKYSNEASFKAVFFEDVQRSEGFLTISKVLEEMFEECSSAIVILTKDDVTTSGEERARQNVIHELGYAQASYGERVLIALEKGVEKPTNLSGHLHVEFTYDSNGSIDIDESKIDAFLNQLLAN